MNRLNQYESFSIGVRMHKLTKHVRQIRRAKQQDLITFLQDVQGLTGGRTRDRQDYGVWAAGVQDRSFIAGPVSARGELCWSGLLLHCSLLFALWFALEVKVTHKKDSNKFAAKWTRLFI